MTHADTPAALHNRRPGLRRICAECGDPFNTHRPDAELCSVTCKTRRTNRERVRGAEMVRMLARWRRDRGRGHVTLADVTRLADRFVSEDRARERGFAEDYEPTAERIRTVELERVIEGEKTGRWFKVGQIELVAGKWMWRAAASGSRRDTSRRRSLQTEAIPMRFRKRGARFAPDPETPETEADTSG